MWMLLHDLITYASESSNPSKNLFSKNRRHITLTLGNLRDYGNYF
jgi:hypothetical protein